MKFHPLYGSKIIKENKLSCTIMRAALEHHEKLDGSGYPKGIRKISPEAQLIGIIDSYEALTNDDRPYRRAQEPLVVLSEYLKPEVKAGKFDEQLFRKFAYSLVKKS